MAKPPFEPTAPMTALGTADSVPLEALRVFAVCAQLRSFTAAAAALGSSQPAISQQIGRLERALGVPVFDRLHRGIALSAAGRALLPAVQESLLQLEQAVHEARGQGQRTQLQVQTDFAFAAFWLLPRLGALQQAHPGLELSLRTDHAHALAPHGDADVSIVFGDGRLAHGASQRLFEEVVFPVCSPHLLERLYAPAVAQAPHTQSRSDRATAWRFEPGFAPLLQLRSSAQPPWFDWPDLLPQWEWTGARIAPLQFDNYTLLLQAAVAGQGIAIGWKPLVDEWLRLGLLVRLGRYEARSPRGYYLLVPHRKRRARWVQDFSQWLHQAVQAPTEPPVAS